VRRKNGSRPLDLGPITRQSSDRTGTVRGLPSDIGDPEVEGIRTL
jgi:hypothetical protein